MIHSFPFIPDFSGLKFLVTGGAGFIGSHFCDFLVHARAGKITVLDNLATGKSENISTHQASNSVTFIQGDITSFDACLDACREADIVIHLAALGSVPRSIVNPIATHDANSTGFLNMLWAAKQSSVKRFIYASSSSVYGDSQNSPKQEGQEGKPLSPYAVTKQTNELYAKVFYDLYSLETIGLRFFNVFGARQNKYGEYAAFMPLVISAAKNNEEISIFGSGEQSRDFTYVANAVWAISCAVSSSLASCGKSFNIGCGKSASLLDIIRYTEEICGNKLKILFKEERKGDIKNSLADLTASSLLLGYQPIYSVKEGLLLTYQSEQV